MNPREAYWDRRADIYNNLKWVQNVHYLKKVLHAIAPKRRDVVLDVGTGTGVVAMTIAPYVDTVIGIDISQKMLNKAGRKENIHYLKWDISNPLFHSEVFEKIVIRQVLHHITEKEKLLQALRICYDILKPNGRFVIAEPVCPADDIKNIYREIFELKDGRQIFTESDFINMMNDAGFKSLALSTFRLKKFSVKNWLDNNDLTPGVQNEIFKMHITAPASFKRAFNMEIKNGDCLIDIKNLILVGKKIK